MEGFPSDKGDGTTRARGFVRSKEDAVRLEGVGEAGELHLLASANRLEEGLELVLIGVILHVAGIDQWEREVAPLVLVERTEPGGVEAVVEEAALGSDEVGVEVVGLDAVYDRSGLADTAIPEADEGDGAGVGAQ